MLPFIKNFFLPKDSLQHQLNNTLGITPKRIALYKQALSHKSTTDNVDKNNERLEFLGDSILGAVVADYLFKKYPYKNEGYLTEMRSKIVNRNQLNTVALKIGLDKLLAYNRKETYLRNSGIGGNALEALIGAVYVDLGFIKTRHFITQRIIIPFMDFDILEEVDMNIKNKLYGWANRNNKILEFEIMSETNERGKKRFELGAKIDGEIIATGTGFTKKEASTKATEKAIIALNL